MFRYILDVFVLVHKETLMIFKDKSGRIILVLPVLLQTLLFGYVATFDLNRVDYALLDEDHSNVSRELARQFDGSGIFRRAATLDNASQIAETLDAKKASMVLHIGPRLERGLNLGQVGKVQILVDGRNSNVAGTTVGYASSIIEAYNIKRPRDVTAPGNTLTISGRVWYNPNLETRWNIISGLLAILSVTQVMVLAGQSVAREKEQGTFDQLLVTPFGPMTIMLGKALPPVFVGIGQSTIVLFIALYWFAIPFSGSYGLLYAGLFIFNFSIVGIGLCISALTATMQQALLFTFSSLMPMILLSGFLTPISSMPGALQSATLLNPVRYGVECAQRIYLEGAGLREMRFVFLPMAVIAVVTLGTASKLFRARLNS